MDSPSDAPPSDFSASTKEIIEARFGHRCALCMLHPPQGLQFYHLLDKTSELHAIGSAYHLISKDFSRKDSSNGVLLCPTCFSYFSSDWSDPVSWSWSDPAMLSSSDPALLSFIPCGEILSYLRSRLLSGDLRHVDAILFELASNPPATTEAIMARPFIHMYTLLPSVDFLQTTRSYRQSTSYLPPRLILDATFHTLIHASGVVSPGTNVYRVFDAATIPLTAEPRELGSIHLSPPNLLGVHHDGSRLYWKLPGCSAGASLTNILARVVLDTEVLNADLTLFLRHLHQCYAAPLPSSSESSL